MKTLEITLPYYDGLDISVDNHLIGWINNCGWDDTSISDRFSFPLPEGNWKILEETNNKIKLGDYS